MASNAEVPASPPSAEGAEAKAAAAAAAGGAAAPASAAAGAGKQGSPAPGQRGHGGRRRGGGGRGGPGGGDRTAGGNNPSSYASRRSPSLENYRRIDRPRGATPDDEIRITSAGPVARYVTYAAKLLGEQNRRGFTVRATGMAISVAVAVVEAMKRQFKGLHQMTKIQWAEVVDEYEPLVEGLPPRVEKRSVPSLSILLTLDVDKCDTTSGCYQPPLDESEIVEGEDALVVAGLRKPRNKGRRNNNGGGGGRNRRRSGSRNEGEKEGSATEGKDSAAAQPKDGAKGGPRKNNPRRRRQRRVGGGEGGVAGGGSSGEQAGGSAAAAVAPAAAPAVITA